MLFLTDTATTEIYTGWSFGSVRCVSETGAIVLVVEDEPLLRKQVVAALEQHDAPHDSALALAAAPALTNVMSTRRSRTRFTGGGGCPRAGRAGRAAVTGPVRGPFVGAGRLPNK